MPWLVLTWFTSYLIVFWMETEIYVHLEGHNVITKKDTKIRFCRGQLYWTSTFITKHGTLLFTSNSLINGPFPYWHISGVFLDISFNRSNNFCFHFDKVINKTSVSLIRIEKNCADLFFDSLFLRTILNIHIKENTKTINLQINTFLFFYRGLGVM